MSEQSTPALSVDDILDRELGREETPTPPDEATPVVAPVADPAEAVAAVEPTIEVEVPDAFKTEWDKRNRENQTLRARAKKYEDAFGTFSDDDQNVLLALTKAIRDDPTAANDWWQENIAGKLSGAEGPAAKAEAEAVVAAVEATGATVPSAPPADVLTRAEMAKMLDEREAAIEARAEAKALKAQQDEFVDRFQKDAVELGYDLDGPKYIALTWVAANKTGSDIHKAHELMQEEFGTGGQAAVDKFVADKAKTPDSTLPSTATPATPPEREGPKTIADADKQFRAFLKEQGISGRNDRFRDQ